MDPSPNSNGVARRTRPGRGIQNGVGCFLPGTLLSG